MVGTLSLKEAVKDVFEYKLNEPLAYQGGMTRRRSSTGGGVMSGMGGSGDADDVLLNKK